MSEKEADPLIGAVVDILRTNLGKEVPDNVIDFLKELSAFSEIKPRQVLQWLESSNYVVRQIASDKAVRSDFSIFWIRIYEVLVFLPRHFELPSELSENLDKVKDLAMIAHIKTHQKMAELLSELQGKFNDDELLFIENQRHTEAHVLQTSYETKIKIKNQNIKVDTIRKGKELKMVRESIRKILTEYNGNADLAAKAYSKRIFELHNLIVTEAQKWARG